MSDFIKFRIGTYKINWVIIFLLMLTIYACKNENQNKKVNVKEIIKDSLTTDSLVEYKANKIQIGKNIDDLDKKNVSEYATFFKTTKDSVFRYGPFMDGEKSYTDIECVDFIIANESGFYKSYNSYENGFTKFRHKLILKKRVNKTPQGRYNFILTDTLSIDKGFNFTLSEENILNINLEGMSDYPIAYLHIGKYKDHIPKGTKVNERGLLDITDGYYASFDLTYLYVITSQGRFIKIPLKPKLKYKTCPQGLHTIDEELTKGLSIECSCLGGEKIKGRIE